MKTAKTDTKHHVLIEPGQMKAIVKKSYKDAENKETE
jgi:hypothetical protein